MSKKILLSLLAMTFVVALFGGALGANARALEPARPGVPTPILYGAGEPEQVRAEVKIITAEEREAIQQVREEARAEITAKREEFKAEAANRMQELKQTREENREELKTKLESFKDEAKAVRVGRLADNLENVNERITSVVINQLDRLSTFLVRVEDRAIKASEAGLDVAEVEEAIALAEAEIASARVLVMAQIEVVYEVDFEDEAVVKEAVEGLRDQMKGDLEAIRDALASAKEAVRDALHTLVGVVDVDTDTDDEDDEDEEEVEEEVGETEEDEVE